MSNFYKKAKQLEKELKTRRKKTPPKRKEFFDTVESRGPIFGKDSTFHKAVKRMPVVLRQAKTHDEAQAAVEAVFDPRVLKLLGRWEATRPVVDAFLLAQQARGVVTPANVAVLEGHLITLHSIAGSLYSLMLALDAEAEADIALAAADVILEIDTSYIPALETLAATVPA